MTSSRYFEKESGKEIYTKMTSKTRFKGVEDAVSFFSQGESIVVQLMQLLVHVVYMFLQKLTPKFLSDFFCGFVLP